MTRRSGLHEEGTSTGGDAYGFRMAAVSVAVVSASTLPLFLVGTMAVIIGEDLGLDPTDLGGLASFFFLASAVSSPISGQVAERIGIQKSILIAATVSLIALTFMGAIARSSTSFAIALLVGGAANGLIAPASSSALSNGIRERRQGIAFAIKQSSVLVAGLAAGLAVPAVGLTFGWRPAFLISAVLTAGLVAAAAHRRPPHQRSPNIGSLANDPMGEQPATWGHAVVMSRPLLMLALAGGLAAGSATLLSVFYVSTAVGRGVAVSSAGVLFGVLSALSVAVRLSAGWVVDRYRRSPMSLVLVMLALGATGFALLGIDHGGSLFLLGSALCFCFGWGWTGLFVLAVVRAYPQMPAAATGITTGAMTGMSAAMPVLFVAIATRWDHGPAWLVAAGTQVVAAALFVLGMKLAVSELART